MLEGRPGQKVVECWSLLQGVKVLDEALHEGLISGPLRHHLLHLGR